MTHTRTRRAIAILALAAAGHGQAARFACPGGHHGAAAAADATAAQGHHPAGDGASIAHPAGSVQARQAPHSHEAPDGSCTMSVVCTAAPVRVMAPVVWSPPVEGGVASFTLLIDPDQPFPKTPTPPPRARARSPGARDFDSLLNLTARA